MLPKSGENIIKQQNGVSINIDRLDGGNLAFVKGTLFLTNQRLLVEEKGGMFSKTSTTVLDIALSKISNVKAESSAFVGDRLVLQMPWKTGASTGEIQVKALCEVKKPEDWAASIKNAVSK